MVDAKALRAFAPRGACGFKSRPWYNNMKKKDIKVEIKKITEDNLHVLDCYPATVQVNAPRALMQHAAISQLNTLYKLLGEKRPEYKCDDFTKVNH